MNKSLLSILLSAAVYTLFTGCSKSELTAYEQPAMAYFYKTTYGVSNDSATYSFAVQYPGTIQDTVRIPVRIMGSAAATDREVIVQAIADSSTAVAGTDYVLLPCIIPAGSFTGTMKVLVKRTAAQKNTEVRLRLQVVAGKDFQPGAVSNISTAVPGATLHYLVKINDFLTKPANWDNLLVYYFGVYSQVKYKLIIDASGRTEFLTSGDNPVNGSTLLFYALQAQKLQAAYEAVNGPMLDEQGRPVTFPY